MPVPFLKMHGLGNDFVILDARKNSFHPTPLQIKRIADRNRGVGCDQLIVLDTPKNKTANKNADLYMGIFNSDGTMAGACGNATRCVAKIEMDTTGKHSIAIESPCDILHATRNDDLITIDMGIARSLWNEIPLSNDMDTLHVNVGVDGLSPAVCVNTGNPHAVFFIDSVDAVDIAVLGKQVENNPLFPQKTNVEFAEVKNRNTIRMRVWERGAGITLACGTGACATLVAAVRRGLTERKADVILDGGVLSIEWLENNHVMMTGPAVFSFSGVLSDELLHGRV
jgi:diaminopimelate epimerase